MKHYFILLTLCLTVTAEAATWYVDPHATGTNNGTSWGNAWTSFSSVEWGKIAAGDTLYLSGGSASQTYSERLTVGASGTAGSPITISVGQEAGHNGNVVIEGGNDRSTSQRGVDLNDKNYIMLTGNVAGAKNLVIQNFVCSTSDRDTTGGAGIWALGQHNIIDHVEINHAMNGIYLSQTSEAFLEVSNCDIHDIVGDYGVRSVGYSGSDFNNTNIHDCTILTNGDFTTINGGPDGVQCQNGMTLHDNIIRSVQGPIIVGQHADGFQGMGNYHKIYNNYFANHANSGCKLGPISGNVPWEEEYVWNNVFTMDLTGDNSGNLERALDLMPDGATCPTVSNIVVCDNTFVDINFLSVFGDVKEAAKSVSGVVFKNNLFYNCGRRAGGSNFLWSNHGNGGLAIDYNLFNKGTDGNPTITVDGKDFTQAHERSAAPIFVSYNPRSPGNDFHLAKSDTAAQGLGVDLSSLFAPLAADKDGMTRAGLWDIGAYGAGSAAAHVPAPPSDLQIVVP